MGFHTLKIKEVRRETANAVSVHFDIDDSVKSDYQYQPGQYVTLKLTVNGEELRRAYSLCSSPLTDNVPAIAVKRVEGGKASNYINDNFKAGDEVEVMNPMGNFTTELNEFFGRHFVLYAGGSGITPMMSILKSVLHLEQSSHVTLVYGNRDEDSIIFQKELHELEGHYADRFKVIHCLNEGSGSWTGDRGLMTADKVKSILNDKVEGDLSKGQHFICGPTPMMNEVKQALSDLSIPDDKVHIEYFTSDLGGAGEGGDSSVGGAEELPFNGVADVKVDVNGNEYEIEVAEKETILHVAQEAGIDPPFACQSGICTTCRAKMLEGSVHMDELEGLTQEELDNNYILTCQAHPKSAKIVIRYE